MNHLLCCGALGETFGLSTPLANIGNAVYSIIWRRAE